MKATPARAFRSLLERSGYRAFHLAFGDGNAYHHKWRRYADRLEEPLRSLVDLLLLQRPLDGERARTLLGDGLLESFLDADVLRWDGAAVRTTGLVLISFRSLLFFVELVDRPRVYFGRDTMALGVYQTPAPGGRTLDLCSGSGIQAMIAALQARQSYGVEIDERASAIAKVNIALNDLTERVTLINSPLEEYARNVKGPFDLITMNPPQLPAPPGITYPVGNGGTDGLAVTKLALSLYLPHLAENGTLQFIGSALGRDGQPLFAEELGALLADHGAHGHAQTTGVIDLRRGDEMYDFMVQIAAVTNGIPTDRAYDLFEEHFRTLDRNEMYSFFMSATKSAGDRMVTVANLAERGKDWMI